jgi:hypothetical protein
MKTAYFFLVLNNSSKLSTFTSNNSTLTNSNVKRPPQNPVNRSDGMSNLISFAFTITASDIDKHPLVILTWRDFDCGTGNFCGDLVYAEKFDLAGWTGGIVCGYRWMMGYLFCDVDNTETFRVVIVIEAEAGHLCCHVIGINGL